jgi:SAM-dependent methyltransferase
VFLDADDRLLPIAIESGLRCFAQSPDSGLVYGGHRRVTADWKPLGPDQYAPIGATPYLDLLRGNPIGMHATVMYRLDRLLSLGGFDSRLRRCEDYDVYFRMARRYPVASHPDIVAEYRWHTSNMSHDHGAMLKAVLAVHGSERQYASKQSETAVAWRIGRSIWRSYYAEQAFIAAKAAWVESRGTSDLGQMTAALLSMMSYMSADSYLRTFRNLLKRTLPDGLVERLKRRRRTRLSPALGRVDLGDLASTNPISQDFGFDRGLPVDRYYIESFLGRNSQDIAGRVLEVGDDTYTCRFGGPGVSRRDVLHVSADNPHATIVGDLAEPGVLPDDVFDCLILTQTLHLIYDMPAAIAQMHRALKPGGVVLLTVPGISQIDRGAWGGTWFWSLTPASARRLFSDVFGVEGVTVEEFGNVYAATAFLQGLAFEEVDRSKLDVVDRAYPVVVTVRAHKAAA